MSIKEKLLGTLSKGGEIEVLAIDRLREWIFW
ncbi:MAG: hypothetical protein MRERV_27c021 [Mycoplasmataceae bacterium RV_VA103A]|nr:MAG: hypothetical protein MRERV_27c021 [Mycoplasmataceae bacterium RV_VA103A]